MILTRLYVVARSTRQLLGRGCSIGHRVGIGHNCNIASNVLLERGSTVSGSVNIMKMLGLVGEFHLNKIMSEKITTVGLGRYNYTECCNQHCHFQVPCASSSTTHSTDIDVH